MCLGKLKNIRATSNKPYEGLHVHWSSTILFYQTEHVMRVLKYTTVRFMSEQLKKDFFHRLSLPFLYRCLEFGVLWGTL